tara:strand:+ start:205 stop:1239 length:1035 start_codon:yes stop_codon:yes gene_type:complete
MPIFQNSKNFLENQVCPLCKTNDFDIFSSSYKNVYSELISEYIGLEEDHLLNKNKVYKCKKCEITFWQFKLSKSIRKNLYENILPNHPKGDDASGRDFNLNSMIRRLDKLHKSSNQRKRILDGYIASMIFNNNSEENKVKNILFENKFNKIENISFIENIFKRGPKYLSRYQGFRKTILNQLIINILKTNKSIINYIEYGCTSWGPIKLIAESGYKSTSIIPKQDIFWNCRSHFNNIESKNYKIIEESDIKGNKNLIENSILSLILILDHIDEPLDFLNNFIEMGVRFIFIVLERQIKEGHLPIQHLTIWDKRSLIYLAERLGAEIKFIDLKSNLYLSSLLEIK